MNNNKSSKQLASKASEVLRDANASIVQKKLAASVLSQRSTNNQTGADLESLASDVLKSNKYNELTKSFAGSVVSQSNRNR